MNVRVWTGGWVAWLAAVALAAPEANADDGIPAFARRYGVSCQLCHAPTMAF